MSKKHISTGLIVAERQNAEAKPKAITVKIKAEARENGIMASVMIGGRFAKDGDLAEVTEAEAADLLLRGRAELVSK